MSLGQRMRAELCAALLHDPKLLFLDEPTNSIDQSGTAIIRQIILEEAQRGAVILMASHIGEDITKLCEEIYSVDAGKCVRLGNV